MSQGPTQSSDGGTWKQLHPEHVEAQRVPFRACQKLTAMAIDLGAYIRRFVHNVEYGYMGACQNYGPSLGPYYNTAPKVRVLKKGP